MENAHVELLSMGIKLPSLNVASSAPVILVRFAGGITHCQSTRIRPFLLSTILLSRIIMILVVTLREAMDAPWRGGKIRLLKLR
jgi:hypothetical protein